jgi:hypothetical protein
MLLSVLLLAVLVPAARGAAVEQCQIPVLTEASVEQADAPTPEPPPGLVLTNFHVVRDARYIAVQTDEVSKVPGVVLARDEDNDLAVIRIHPDATAGLKPLPLLTDAEGADLAVGERIMAIGFPLAQESVLTTGVVGKIEEATLITDVTINPGNSGGPILDLRGRVIAVATFGVQGESGPGVGGAVRSHVARAVLSEARGLLADNDPPDAELLPITSRDPFPVEALRESLRWEKGRYKGYHVEAGKFDVQVTTPVAAFYIDHWGEIKAAKRQAKRRKKKDKTAQQDLYDPAGDVFNWKQYVGAYEPVVSLLAMPELKETGGSKAGRIFGAMFGVVTPGNYRFKQDFREMKLLRDGQEVQPIVPGRLCQAVSIQGYGRLNDVGCMGAYAYRPEEFHVQGSFQLIVTSEEEPDKLVTVELTLELLERIREDFRLFFDTDQAAPDDGDEPAIALNQ